MAERGALERGRLFYAAMFLSRCGMFREVASFAADFYKDATNVAQNAKYEKCAPPYWVKKPLDHLKMTFV